MQLAGSEFIGVIFIKELLLMVPATKYRYNDLKIHTYVAWGKEYIISRNFIPSATLKYHLTI